MRTSPESRGKSLVVDPPRGTGFGRLRISSGRSGGATRRTKGQQAERVRGRQGWGWCEIAGRGYGLMYAFRRGEGVAPWLV